VNPERARPLAPRRGLILAAERRPFWGDGEVTLGQVTGELAGRGWLATDGDGR